MSNFHTDLKFGKLGESLIANWFKAKGYDVLPVYEKEIHEGKGPQIFTAQGNFIAPDLLVFGNGKKAFWIEAKHKSAFTWHRLTKQWVTGIDVIHYANFLEIADRSPWPTWLMFLQWGGMAKDTPHEMISPTGLYGGDLSKLRFCEHHRHRNWGKSGMVYWAEQTLTKIAELDEILDL